VEGPTQHPQWTAGEGTSIHIFLIVAIINGWHSRQIDFVLVYPQANSECDLYMAIPAGFNVNDNRKDYVLKLVKNLYGQKQAGRVWNNHLHDGLMQMLGFVQSEADPCIYYRGSLVFLLYTDNSILLSPTTQRLTRPSGR
jgi:hypothetical protein